MKAKGRADEHPLRTLARGLVVATQRRHYAVALESGGTVDCVLRGRSLTLACGDRVDVQRSSSGNAVVGVQPRTSLLYRSDAFKQKLIAANVTQVVAVVAPDVPVDEHLLNRWIIAAETERCRFVLAVNKADLADASTFASRFAPYRLLGYPVILVSAKHDATPLQSWVAGQQSVLIGQSGMGKSTLINAIVPDASAKIGLISEALRSGRHTTTSTTLYRLAGDGGWIVDSPGMKVFGLAHCAPATIANAFVELRDLVAQCRFSDCRHEGEPGCAVLPAVSAGAVNSERVLLLRTLLDESRAARDPARR